VYQGGVSVYIKIVDILSLRQKYKDKEHEEENDKNRRKLLLDALKLTGISRSDTVPNYRGIFQAGPDYRKVQHM
jgi:hypothetical protein